jgi:hypothetical protein
MVKLTEAEGREIYYALESKVMQLREGRYGEQFKVGEDARWMRHLNSIRRRIGIDGCRALAEGVRRSD